MLASALDVDCHTLPLFLIFQYVLLLREKFHALMNIKTYHDLKHSCQEDYFKWKQVIALNSQSTFEDVILFLCSRTLIFVHSALLLYANQVSTNLSLRILVQSFACFVTEYMRTTFR